MHLVVVGLSHKTAPIEVRERVALPEGELPVRLKELLDSDEVREGMLISTCNRVEAYLVARHAERGEGIARDFLTGRANGRSIDPCLYVKVDGEAIAHLLRVTSGLDSLVMGEPQIGGQVKTAYTQAVSTNATGEYLNKLVHRALHVSKRIRTETGIGQHPVSVSYAAVLLAQRIFSPLTEKEVLVVGAGEMGQLACQYLKERGVRRIVIANRSREKAEELARILEGEPRRLGEIPALLERADVVITSVERSEPIIDTDDVRRAMSARKGRPMFFMDIGVPRNVDPAVHRIENVFLYNIDDLRGIIEANREEREREAKRAEAIVGEEVESFLAYLRQRELSPTIQQLSKKFESIRAHELRRYFQDGALAPEVREDLEACTRAIVNKILHDPIILMKTEEAKEGAPKYSEILKKLFRLDSE